MTTPAPQTPARAWPTRFVGGLKYPFRGAKMMISTPALWPYVMVPILITTSFILGAFWFSWSHGGDWATWLFPRPTGDTWLASTGRGLWVVSQAIARVLVFAALAVLGWFVGGLLASPFYDRLSDQVERLVRGEGIDEAFDLSVMVRDVLTGLLHSLGAVALYLSLSCPLTLLEMVPLFGQVIHLVVSVSLTAFFLAREVLDYSLSRRRVGFADKLRLVWRHRARTGGLGLGTFAILWVPLLNFLSMPAAVIGGTLMFCDLEADGAFIEPSDAP